MERILILSYSILAGGYAAYAVVRQVQPARFFIELFAPQRGDTFSGSIIFLLVFVLLLLPLIFWAMMRRALRSRVPEIDHSTGPGIFVTRKKAFQSALIGIPIYINGRKVGKVDNGKTKFFPLPVGEFSVRAGTGRQSSGEIREVLADQEHLYFTCEARDAGYRVEFDLEMTPRDLI